MIRLLFTAVVCSLMGYAAGRYQLTIDTPAIEKISSFVKEKKAAVIEKAGGEVCITYNRGGQKKEACFDKAEQ